MIFKVDSHQYKRSLKELFLIFLYIHIFSISLKDLKLIKIMSLNWMNKKIVLLTLLIVLIGASIYLISAFIPVDHPLMMITHLITIQIGHLSLKNCLIEF